jgi:phosphatidyl-myo-inositol alpha-mannosyltransferase
VFCLPSSYEGFGIPYAEALMSGLPVVATPNPGARYVLDGCSAASLVPDGELGAALIQRLLDPDPSATAVAAVAHAMPFRLREVLDDYEALYRSAAVPPRLGGQTVDHEPSTH